MNRKLTSKQQKFADEYIESGNATKAAVAAGYSKRTAYSIGPENLKKPEVKSYIQQKMKEIEDNKIMSAKEAVQLLTRIARGEEKETVVVSGPDGLEETIKEADLKTRIAAIREILKRYPESNEFTNAQVRKAIAEAELQEIRVKAVKEGNHSVEDKLAEYMNKITEEATIDDTKENLHN